MEEARDKKTEHSCGGRFAVLIAAFLAIVLVSVVIGRYSVSLTDMFRILRWKAVGGLMDFENWLNRVFHASFDFGLKEAPTNWSAGANYVFLQIRLPRLLAAILVGASLSIAGSVYQGMFRNPMVSPDILGASTGAGFGAALAILTGAGYARITLFSFGFGLLAVGLAYAVSRLGRASEIVSLILAGMVISSLFSSGTSFIKLVADTQEQLPAITYWLMGSLASIKPEDVMFLIGPVLAGMIPLILLRWRLNLLTVEEDSAETMGINTRLLRLVVILCATLLTAVSVSVSGMIGWIGLVIPHFCRMIFGYDYRRIVPASILFGGAFLLAVDDIARTVTTAEIPLGILTSFVGAPLFLFLLATGGGRRD